MILTGDIFYPNAENLLSILILQFVSVFMHVFHLLYFVSNDNNKDVQSVKTQGLFTTMDIRLWQIGEKQAWDIIGDLHSEQNTLW